MNRMKKYLCKTSSVLLSCILSLSLWGFTPLFLKNTKADTKDTYKKILDPDLPDSYDETDSTNPYSNDKQKFLLAENNELVLFQSWNGNSRWMTMADNYSNGKSMKLGKSGADDKAGWSSVYGNNNVDAPYLNYQACVAFDPNGTGRKDHVAYVGYKNNHNYLWVYDTVKKTCSSEYQLPNSFAAKSMQYLPSRNFYTITAGDYNDNGKDTIVVYNPCDNNNFDILEYSYKDNSFNQIGSSKRMLHEVYCGQSDIYNKDDLENKLGCNLTTGDFDGDGVDDLGVISYGQEYKDKNSFSDYRLYTPMVSAIFGDDQDNNKNGSSWSIVNSGQMQKTYVALNKQRESINKTSCDTYDTMRSPSISAGDADGDGHDELICSGFYSKVKDNGSSSSYDTKITYSKITASAVSVSRKTINLNGNTVNSNEWSKHTARHKSYDAKVQVATQCVAINGQSAAEVVFINGTFYQYTGNGFGELYTPAYFKKDDYDLPKAYTDSCAVTDVVAGVFDGNTQGREQVIFAITQREYGSVTNNDHYITLGAMGGSDYDDTNTAKSYYSSNIDKDHYTIENKGDEEKKSLNACLAAADNDNDGLIASYHDKRCIYNDPKTAAVLQAAPFFESLDNAEGYDDSGETSYSLSTSYEEGKSSGNSVSFGAGFATNIEASLGASFEAELRLGYSLDWNETFEESTATTYTTSFSAQTQDQVILSRIPVTIYNYDIYKADGTKQEYGYAVSVPGKPVYYQLGIDEYNDFVDIYNQHVDEVYEKNKDHRADKSEKPVKLKKIHKDTADSSGKYDLPSDNEGNPQNYFSSWAAAGNGATTLSQSPLALSYNTGSSTSEWNTSSSSTHATEMSHGFSFEATVMAGGGLLGNNAKVGGYVSLDYMHSKGSYTTKTKESGASGTVQNLNEKNLINAGYPKSVVRAYGFNWEFGTWKRELTTTSSDYTPFFGYRVFNITMPPLPPENLKASHSDTDGIHSVDLTWDKVDSKLVTGYNIYIKDGNNYTKVNNALITDSKYTVSSLDSNTDYTFVVTTEAYTDLSGNNKTNTANSIWSEEADITTPRQGYPILLTTDNGSTIKASSGEKEVSDGDEIFEGDAITIKASALDGYTITQILLKKSDGTTTDITSTDGSFSFVVKGKTQIIVKTKRNIDQSEITYSSNGHGNITSAVSDGESFKSGALVSDAVTLTATADDGYVLKEWINTANGKKINVLANGNDSYTFGLYAAKHEIEAVFVPKDDPSINQKITVSNTDGGSILITDDKGNTYEPVNGTVSVNVGTNLTFTAKPDPHYVLKSWSGDFINVSRKNTKINHTIYEDLKIGAEFYAPVKYTVSYGTNNDSYGKISSDISKQETYVADTKLSFKATPTSGYRLEYWKVKTGDEEDIIKTKELKSSYNLTVSLKGNTNVTAYFTPIEKYTLHLASSDHGSIEAINQKKEVLKNGDSISYGDILTLTAKPKENHELKSFMINGSAAKNGSSITVYDNVSASADYLRLLSKDDNPISDVEVTLSPSSMKYTGKALTPDVSVKVGDVTLTADDYVVSYSNNTLPGTATVLITGKGFYKGSITKTFTIKENTSLYRQQLLKNIKVSSTQKRMSVQWGKTDLATGYDVYITKCSKKFSKKPTLTTKKTAISVSKINKKKLNPKNCYKVYIKAYRMVNGKKYYMTSSFIYHCAGTKNKYTNVKAIYNIPSRKSLTVGQKYKLKAKVKKRNKKKSLLPKKHVVPFKYWSSDSSIASVNSSGTITAKKSGNCYIYINAADGTNKAICINVK